MLKHKLTVLAAALCGALVMSGCSSTSSREPAELEDVRELVQGDELWSENLGATEGSLLTPAVTSNGIYGAGGKALPEDEITMDDDLPNGKDVDADEAADAGFEIQDEDDVFGLLNDSYTMDSDADSENE